ncbi:hypothetical protein [Leptothermofonsia sp. ETS-13]|uniref:hypothetical protein n=1 Tax=Leptothermofonsia sp. ETS-13 TaxID=3035696 RepID=UPI003BA300E7
MVQDTSQQETTIVKGSNISKLRSGRWVRGVLSSTVLVTLLTPGEIIHNITTAFLNRLPPIEVLNPGSLGNFRVTQTVFQDEDCIQPSKFANFNSPSKELTVDSALCSLSNCVALFIKGPRFPNGTYQFVPIKSAQTNAFVDFWV